MTASFAHLLGESLAISCQRYPWQEHEPITGLPRSWGALPLLPTDDSRVCFAVPADEAFWVGLTRLHEAWWSLQVAVTLSSGLRCDVQSGLPLEGDAPASLRVISTPPTRELLGWSAGAGLWWPFTRSGPDPTTHLEFFGREEPLSDRQPPEPLAERLAPLVMLELLEPEDFRNRGGGEVPVLDPDSPYRGWRLP